MNYSNIIREMTWSYSRVLSFNDCPYKWFLTYIKRREPARMFFSDYGTFAHRIIEMYLKGELPTEELAGYYMENFRSQVRGRAPNPKVFRSYFTQGLEYFNDIHFPYRDILNIEGRVDFKVEGIPFQGIIDCAARDESGIILVDNKSRALKPRSNRAKPTKTDEELDKYLRQLYIYSIPVKEYFGEYPSRLEFNCFRTKTLVSEPFKMEAFESAKSWAVNSIRMIEENENWKPNMDYWRCKHLCDRNQYCEYFELNGW